MDRFATAMGSQVDAVNAVADAANFANTCVYNSVTSNNPTLAAAKMVGGIVKLSGQTGAQTVTTDTATNIVAAIPGAQVGSVFELVIINANSASGAATLAGGSGVTLVGDVDVPIAQSQIYRGIVTGVGTPAVSLYGLLSAAQLVDNT